MTVSDTPSSPTHIDWKADTWLSGLMGCPAIGVVAHPDGPHDLGNLPDGPLFASLRLPGDDPTAIAPFFAAGFRLVDTAVTLSKPRTVSTETSGVRFARPDDEAAVRRIAHKGFRFSRFHADPAVSNALADTVKEAWAANYFTGGRGTHMVVAEQAGEVAGFLLLIVNDARILIDLIAVSDKHRGAGLGTAMIGFAETQVRGPQDVIVGTQLANISSLRFYTKLGFRPVGAHHVLHLTKRGNGT